MKYLITIIFSILSLHAISQNNLILTNADPIDPLRYDDIKGSPYLFDDFTLGEIDDKNGEVYKDVLLNYNAYIDVVEVRKGSKYIELAQRTFKNFNITDQKELKNLGFTTASKLAFIHKPHPELENAYYMELFNAQSLQVYVLLRKKINSTVENVPGKIVERNKFRTDKELIVIHNDNLIKTSFKKKTIIKSLKFFGDIDKFAKQQKLKVDRYETIMLFLKENMNSL